jgi:hypothetical protein
VVAVAVAAVGVVGDEQVGAFGAQDRRESLGGLLERGAGEAHLPRHVGFRLRPAAAVGIAEPLDAGHAEGLRRCSRLGQAQTAELPVGAQLGRCQPGPAIGGEHEDDAVALAGQARHRAGRQQGLVVGVGMERHDRCETSPPILAHGRLSAREGRHAL